MKRLFKHTFFLSVLTVLLISCTALGQSTLTGSLPDGATYLIEVPAQWNGTLLLYSHGYVPPGAANPAQDVGDPGTRLFLLENGFALAGSSYPSTGWAVHEALIDQMAVLDLFDNSIGHPQRTIAWGHSMGGGITAGLIQRFPNRFDAALPMCGVLSGGVGIWNEALDTVFAFKTLLGFGTGLQVVHITDPLTNLTIGEQLLATAQSTPQGRARIALSAALSDFPGWFDPALPEPAATDFDAQEVNQFLWFANVDFPFLLAFRTELEFRAGGNPSFNTGVNYRKQLARSVDREEVEALYAAAGLSLDADLDTLNNAARITADPGATDYLVQNIIYNGVIHVPVLAMHTSGDGLVVPQNESAYQLVVDQANDDDFLRQTYVHRAGHCTFTPAETVTALGVLLNRLDTGRWSGLSPEDLNGIAAQLGPLNTAPPSFFSFSPGPFLRPFDAGQDQ
jgi:pimeloyl-ACP methyl ester carboxylesterase